MIEKLKGVSITNNPIAIITQESMDVLINKVNELIDVVNELQKNQITMIQVDNYINNPLKNVNKL